MSIALNKLAQEDPSFRVSTDEESGQTIISGMGELHLEIIVDRMLREFKVEAEVGQPQVAYRETIRKLLNKNTNTLNNQVVVVSMDMYSYALNRLSQVVDMNLLMILKVG